MRMFKLKNICNAFALVLLLVPAQVVAQSSPPAENPQAGGVGMQGTISTPPPTQGAVISIPTNGQTFNTLPVTVSGICPKDLLVKLFKNNVFAGSQQCTNGSFSMQIDLFNGANDLVARVYDALDQAGPDSNTVTVTFADNRQGAGPRVTLSSDYAKRGANPGQTLTWPIIISGGAPPYAISVDWGDGKAPDLISQAGPGSFDIEHVYDSPGVYNIVIKATDANGESAFLQLVGVANGPLSQENQAGAADGSDGSGRGQRILVWQPAALAIPLIITTFWLGKRHELKTLRTKIEQGQRPF